MSFNQSVIEEFRAHGGKVGGPFEGGDLLLLTTTGARSGKEHTTPLGYVRHDGRLLVVGSAGGADRHPAWYHNLLAHPMVRVEVGTDAYYAIAVPAEGERRDRLFAEVVRAAPGYADYQERTSRIIPVVVLERSGPEAAELPAEVADFGAKLLEIHAWLRAQLRAVRAEAAAYFADRDDRSVPGLGLQIRQHCLAFCESLEFHHTSEDAGMFPMLEQHHPDLRAALDRMREEHVTVHRIKGELLGLLGGARDADPGRFLAELDRMTAELTAHLDHEETVLLPVLARMP
ncbi:nitroreductase/quinone reductase family protein, partial [Streptomyces sp. NPDC059853]|uniref:nitroreductase/quinone reductase family protein n=1 Tax=Streptomyces sp. NPDC059853 TaxID=3346973 RepID=UPI00365D403E